MNQRRGVSKIVLGAVIIVVIAVAAAAFLLVPGAPSQSSSTSASSSTSSGSASTGTGSSATSTSATSTTSTVTPQSGGTLIFSGSEPTVLQQAQVQFAGIQAIISYDILEGLVSQAPDGSFHPLLSTGWTQLNGTTWVFQLRQGVKFSDGTDFNVTAAVDAFQLHKAQKGWFAGFDSNIAAVGPYNGTAMWVQNKYNFPALDFLAQMSYDNAIESPSHEAKVCGSVLVVCAAINRSPVGTGPFVLVSWVPGQYMNATRNTNYWGTKSYIDNILVKFVSDPTSNLLSFQTGQADIFVPLMSQVAQLKAAGTTVMVGPQEQDNVLHFNYTKTGMSYTCTGPSDCKQPWQNPLVRQAMYYATDRQTLVDQFTAGTGVVSTGPLPIADSIYGLYNASLAQYPVHANYTKAKQLLTQAGYPNGFSVTLSTTPTFSGIDAQSMITAIQQMWANVGINVNIKIVALGSTQTRPYGGLDWDMTVFGYNGNSLTPNWILQGALSGAQLVPNGFNWYINDTTINGYLATLRSTDVKSAQQAAINGLVKYYNTNALEIQLFYASGAEIYAVSNRVHGLTMLPYAGNTPILDNPALGINVWLSTSSSTSSHASMSPAFGGANLSLTIVQATEVATLIVIAMGAALVNSRRQSLL